MLIPIYFLTFETAVNLKIIKLAGYEMQSQNKNHRIIKIFSFDTININNVNFNDLHDGFHGFKINNIYNEKLADN